MKRVSSITNLSVLLMLALASPSLAAKPKKAQPVDNSPVVTPDTTTPPAGTAAPTGTVQVAAPGSASASPAPYAIPVGGAQAQPAPAAPPLQPAPPPPPPGPPPAPVVARAEQCVRANVERVVRAESSAKLAVDLLLADVCAEEVDAASLYVRNTDALAEFNPTSERGRAGLSTAHVDPETGQITAPPNVDVSAAVDHADQVTVDISAALRKLAAELVLTEKARLAAPTPHPAAAQTKKSR